MEEDFFNSLIEASEKLLSSKEAIRIISHNDCDGISAAAILIIALKKLERNFVVSFVKNLTPDVLKDLTREEYKTVVFLDLGSSSLEQINNVLKDKDVFIFDHHQMQNTIFNGVFVNPLQYNIDGENGISASGISYLLTKIINPKNKENAYLALVGAIGDMQEYKGFSGLNKKILEDAKDSLEIRPGLRIFGSSTRHLHKALEYSTEIYIPGVTGDEKGAINFLQKLDIPLQDRNGRYRKLVNLSNEELKTLVSAIILERMKTEKNAEDILGNVYLLKSESDEDITKDLREFSTLLNATARLNKSSIGLGVCLNDKSIKEKAYEVLSDYKFEIINALNWFYSNKNTNKVIETDNLVIINAEEYIRDTMTGTIASIISKSNIYKTGTVIIAMSHTIDGFTKISARISGNKQATNLRSLLETIVQKVGGQTGGHDNAAGALILQEKDDEFIMEAKKYHNQIEEIAQK